MTTDPSMILMRRRFAAATCLRLPVKVFASLALCALAACGGGAGDETAAVPQDKAHAASALRAPDYSVAVQQLYVSYFGRPADPAGLANFRAALAAAGAPSDIQGLNAAYNQNATVRALVDAFGTSAESNALYTGNTVSFVTAIYRNVLNRTPDAEGLKFWVDALDRKGLTKGNAALSIMAGALANTSSQGQLDAALVARRISAASSFTATVNTPANIALYSGDAAAAIGRTMLVSVTTSTDSSVLQAAIDNAIVSLDKAAHPAPPAGTVDASFGTSGIAFDNVTGAEHDEPVALLMQPDGKFLVVTNTHDTHHLPQVGIRRYNTNGGLDTTFGKSGKTGLSIGLTPTAAALQTDGKILLTGYLADGMYSCGLTRLNADGTTDATFGMIATTFGTAGIAPLLTSTIQGRCFAVAVQPDGKIVVAGSRQSMVDSNHTVIGPYLDFALARFNANGSIDSSFGNGGCVVSQLISLRSDQNVRSIALQPDGKIVVAGSTLNVGSTRSAFLIARYLPSGTLDLTFGTKGATGYGGVDEAQQLLLQPDGMMVVAGQVLSQSSPEYYSFAVQRVNMSGALDTTFGELEGAASTRVGSSGSGAYTAALQSDGKIVVAGYSAEGIGIVRYGTDGRLDESFGDLGMVTKAISAGATAVASVIQKDGKIVVLASTEGGVALVRFWP